MNDNHNIKKKLFLSFFILITLLPFVSAYDWALEKELVTTQGSNYAVDISPDNELIAYVGEHKKVYIRNTTDWSLVATLTNSSGAYYILAIAFSSDGNYIAYEGADNGYVFVHDTTNWDLVATLYNGSNGADINSIDFTDKYLAFTDYGVAGWNGVYVYNTTDWSRITVLTESTDPLKVAISPNNNYIAYAGYNDDLKIYVHDTSDWSLVATLTNSTGAGAVLSMDMNNDFIAYGDWSKNVYVHNTTDWSLVTNFATGDYVRAIRFSDKWLAYSSEVDKYGTPKRLSIRNTTDFTIENSFKYPADTIYAISSIDKYIAFGGGRDNITIY